MDTKSSNGQNLLHFVERVVSQHFPHVEGFMDELAKPSEANRVNFLDMQSVSKKMLEDIRGIRQSLQTYFADVADGYSRKMFRFGAVAEEELQEVRDGILQAEKLLRDVQTYYGEGEEMGRPLQSQDFFGIFRTFTASWKVSDRSVLQLKISSVEIKTELGWKRLPVESEGLKLVLPSHLRQLVPRRAVTLSTPECNGSNWKGRRGSSGPDDRWHRRSRLFPLLPTFRSSCCPNSETRAMSTTDPWRRT